MEQDRDPVARRTMSSEMSVMFSERDKVFSVLLFARSVRDERKDDGRLTLGKEGPTDGRLRGGDVAPD